MKEKHFKLFEWTHHIATFAGVFLGIKFLFNGSGGAFKKILLGIFTFFQSFALLKVLAELAAGQNREAKRLESSYKKLEGTWGAKKDNIFFASIMALSVLFKAGVPFLFK